MSDAAKDFIAGTFGGTALVITGHPFDTLKGNFLILFLRLPLHLLIISFTSVRFGPSFWVVSFQFACRQQADLVLLSSMVSLTVSNKHMPKKEYVAPHFCFSSLTKMLLHTFVG